MRRARESVIRLGRNLPKSQRPDFEAELEKKNTCRKRTLKKPGV